MAKSKQVKITKNPGTPTYLATCPTCGGTGQQSILNPAGQMEKRTCFHCKGTGKVIAWVKGPSQL